MTFGSKNFYMIVQPISLNIYFSYFLAILCSMASEPPLVQVLPLHGGHTPLGCLCRHCSWLPLEGLSIPNFIISTCSCGQVGLMALTLAKLLSY